MTTVLGSAVARSRGQILSRLLRDATEEAEAPGVESQCGQIDGAGGALRARAAGLLRQGHRRRDFDERRPAGASTLPAQG